MNGPLTDEQIDLLIDQQKPALRNAYRAVFGQGQPFAIAKVGTMPLPNGASWDIGVVVAQEPMAMLIQGTLQGYVHLNQSFQRMVPQPKQTVAPAQSSTSAFGL